MACQAIAWIEQTTDGAPQLSEYEIDAICRVVLAAEALYEALDEPQVDSPEAHALARALDGEE